MLPNNRLSINTLLNISGGAGSILVYIITTPLLLNMLGLDGFGAFTIIWIILGIASAIDLGIGRALSYELAHRGEKLKFIGGRIGFAVGRALLVGMAISGIFAIFSNLFLKTFLPSFYIESDQTSDLMIIVCLAIPVSSASTVLMLVLEGQRRFVSANIYQILATVLVQAGPVVLFYLNVVYSAHEIIASAIIMRIIAFFLLYIIILLDPNTRRGVWPDKMARKKLISFGAKVQISSLTEPVIENIDKLILSSAVGPTAVAVYSIPFQIHSKIKLIPISLARSVIPEVAAARDREAQMDVAEQALRMLICAVTPLLAIMLAFYSPVMKLWLGSIEGAKVANIGTLLMLGVWFNCIAHVPFGAIQGAGRPGVLAALQAAQIVPYVALMFVLIHFFGIEGAAIAWLMRAIVDCIILIWMSGLRRGAIASAIPHILVFMSVWIATVVINNLNPSANLHWILGAFAFIYLAISLRSLMRSA